ncbi:hypothetical protein AB6A23_05820 [Paenibacillus tarimensis]
MKDADLTVSRIAVLHLPVISTLDLLDSYRNLDEGIRNLKIYFPEGESDEFFILESGIISYYQVKEHSAWIRWTALLGEDKSKKALSFIPDKNVIREIGGSQN